MKNHEMRVVGNIIQHTSTLATNSYFHNITNGTFTSMARIPGAIAGLHAVCKAVGLGSHPHYWMVAQTDTFRLKCAAWCMSET
jgi:hypothetical protein